MTIPIPPAIAKIAPDGKLTPRQVRRLMIDMAMRKEALTNLFEGGRL